MSQIDDEEWATWCDKLCPSPHPDDEPDPINATDDAAQNYYAEVNRQAGEEAVEVAPKARFQVVDRETLNYAVGVVVTEKRTISDLKAYAAQCKEGVKAAERRLENFLSYFGPQMEAVQRSLQVRGSKTVALPSGLVAMRFKPAAIEVTDETKCIDWCHQNAPEALCLDYRVTTIGTNSEFQMELAALCAKHGLAVNAETALSKSALNRLFQNQGLLPDGCAFKAGVEELTVTPHKSKEIEVSNASTPDNTTQ